MSIYKAKKFILTNKSPKNLHILEDGESGYVSGDIAQVSFLKNFVSNMIELHWIDDFWQKCLMMTSSVWCIQRIWKKNQVQDC